MTNEEIKAANVVLSRLIPNDPSVWKNDLFKYWLREEREKYNDNRFSTLIADTTDSTYNNVHGFLLYSERKNRALNNIKEVAFWLTLAAAIISAVYAVLAYYKDENKVKSSNSASSILSKPMPKRTTSDSASAKGTTKGIRHN